MLKRLLFFIILVAVICTAFYYGSPQIEQKLPDPVWPAVDAEKVDRIDICVEPENCFSLIRSASHWNVLLSGWKSSPYADTEKVEELIGVLSRGRALRYIGSVNKADLSQYGLEPPHLEIVTGGGQVLTIDVGAESPSEDGVFAHNSLEPGQLFLLGKDYAELSGVTPGMFCDLHLARGSSKDVESITMSIDSTPDWKIAREPESEKFVFQFPASLEADSVSTAEVDLLIHSLFETGAKALVQNSTGKIEKEVLNIELGMIDKSHQTVNVFRTDNDKIRYIANSTVQYGNFVLDKGHVDQLKRTAFDMRRRNVLSLETGKVGSMKINQGNQTFSAFKSEGVWKSSSEKSELLGIDMSLWRLNELRFEAESVKSLGENVESVMAWEMMDQEGKRLAKVEFLSDANLPEGQCWLSVGNRTEFYPVSNKLLEDLQGQIPLRK